MQNSSILNSGWRSARELREEPHRLGNKWEDEGPFGFIIHDNQSDQDVWEMTPGGSERHLAAVVG